MNRHFIVGGVLFGAVSSALTWAGSSSADTTVVEAPAPAAPSATVVATPGAAPAAERDGYTGPNRWMIESGLATFGLSYIPALVVAGTRAIVSADHHLFVPLAGPWLDLGDRPGCGAGHIGCDTETTYKVLLVVDGLFQSIGAITAVTGFLTPEHREVVTTSETDKPTLHVVPSNVATGYGLSAFGEAGIIEPVLSSSPVSRSSLATRTSLPWMKAYELR